LRLLTFKTAYAHKTIKCLCHIAHYELDISLLSEKSYHHLFSSLFLSHFYIFFQTNKSGNMCTPYGYGMFAPLQTWWSRVPVSSHPQRSFTNGRAKICFPSPKYPVSGGQPSLLLNG